MAYDHDDRDDDRDEIEIIERDDPPAPIAQNDQRSTRPPARTDAHGAGKPATHSAPRKRYESGGEARDSRYNGQRRFERKPDPRLELIGDMPVDELKKALVLIESGKMQVLLDLAEAEERRKKRAGTTLKWILRILWWGFDKFLTVVGAGILGYTLLRYIPGALPGIV